MDIHHDLLNFDFSFDGQYDAAFHLGMAPPTPPAERRPGSNPSSPSKITQVSGAITARTDGATNRRLFSVSFQAQFEEGEASPVVSRGKKPRQALDEDFEVEDEDHDEAAFEEQSESRRIRNKRGASKITERALKKDREDLAEIARLRAQGNHKEADKKQKKFDRKIANRESAAGSRDRKRTALETHEDLVEQARLVGNLGLRHFQSGSYEHEQAKKLLKMARK